MTQRAGTSPDGGVARYLIAIPLGSLIALAVASMIGWVVLGLPVSAYVPLKMPQFVWYYRGDPRVVKAMAGGLAGGFGNWLITALVRLSHRQSGPSDG